MWCRSSYRSCALGAVDLLLVFDALCAVGVEDPVESHSVEPVLGDATGSSP